MTRFVVCEVTSFQVQQTSILLLGLRRFPHSNLPVWHSKCCEPNWCQYQTEKWPVRKFMRYWNNQSRNSTKMQITNALSIRHYNGNQILKYINAKRQTCQDPRNKQSGSFQKGDINKETDEPIAWVGRANCWRWVVSVLHAWLLEDPGILISHL